MQVGVSFFFVLLVFLIDIALQADERVSSPSAPSPACSCNPPPPHTHVRAHTLSHLSPFDP